MIELNLLPDIKLEYIKAQRARRLILSISVLVSAVALTLLLLLLSVDGLQKKHLNDLNTDIKNYSSELQGKPNINQILTVQNQLESLTALHAGKPNASQLFGYLDQVTPAAVDINSFTVDFTADTVIITGESDTLASVNQYIDTLKFTTYMTDKNPQSTKAFNNVVLAAFSLNTGAATQSNTTGVKPSAATFTVNAGFDKNIFDITQKPTLNVPNEVSTRSNVANPKDLFMAAPTPSNTPNGGTH